MYQQVQAIQTDIMTNGPVEGERPSHTLHLQWTLGNSNLEREIEKSTVEW